MSSVERLWKRLLKIVELRETKPVKKEKCPMREFGHFGKF